MAESPPDSKGRYARDHTKHCSHAAGNIRGLSSVAYRAGRLHEYGLSDALHCTLTTTEEEAIREAISKLDSPA